MREDRLFGGTDKRHEAEKGHQGTQWDLCYFCDSVMSTIGSSRGWCFNSGGDFAALRGARSSLR